MPHPDTVFQLNINFSTPEMRQLAGQRIVLVKPGLNPESRPVVWVGTEAMQVNTFTWQERYTLYAAHYPTATGHQPLPLLTTAVQAGDSLRLQNYYQELRFGLQPPTTPLQSEQCQLVQPLNLGMSYGLAQDVTVNGVRWAARPLHTRPVPMGESAVFTFGWDVFLCLHPSLDSGTVLDALPANAVCIPPPQDWKTQILARYDGERFSYIYY